MFFNLLKFNMMNRKNSQWVCSCTPRQGIVSMDAKLLHQLVDRQLRTIGRTEHPRIRAQRALWLGDLCEKAGFPMMAFDIWRDGMCDLYGADYEWVYTPINTRLFRFNNLVSMEEAREMGRRIDRMLAANGYRELCGYGRQAVNYYRDLWEEKYYEALP